MVYNALIYRKIDWGPEMARCAQSTLADRRGFSQVRQTFDWLHPTLRFAEVWKITRRGRRRIEGLVGFEPQPDFVLLWLLEVHPRNRRRSGEYFATGALLAIVAQRSVELGFSGHFAFQPKTVLWDYYVARFAATAIPGRRGWLQVEERAAAALIHRYLVAER